MSYLRNSLVPGLQAISYNENRQKSYFKLYEIGAIHTQQINSHKDK